jgi:putative membrane protein
LVGGIAGSIAMGQFVHFWGKLTQSDIEKQGMQSTVKAASAVSETVLDRKLTEEEKPAAATAVHFGFGGLMGAVYGAMAATAPMVASAAGVPFGAAVYAGARAAAVPALSLSRPVTENPPIDEAGEFLGHLLYGVVTHLTHRGVIAAVKAM